MEAILHCGEKDCAPDYENVTSFRNRQHRRPLRPQRHSVSLSVVRQKRRTVKMFFSNFPVDCNADLGIGGRLET
jgi:hypothetical protein